MKHREATRTDIRDFERTAAEPQTSEEMCIRDRLSLD